MKRTNAATAATFQVGSAGIGKPMRDTASPVEEESKFEIDLLAEGVTFLTFDPLRTKARCGNLRDGEDQRKILWLIRKKRPKLVIGYGKCILFCTVLHRDQTRRGAWFLHDLSGDASQLSLPCMIRLECRHDVFHALGNARDRRDGRTSELPHEQPTYCQKGGRHQPS